MASFGIFCPLHESLDELVMDRLAMIDGMEGFLFRIGRWSEAYEMQRFHFRKTEKMLGKEHPDTLGSMKPCVGWISGQAVDEYNTRISKASLAAFNTRLD